MVLVVVGGGVEEDRGRFPVEIWRPLGSEGARAFSASPPDSGMVAGWCHGPSVGHGTGHVSALPRRVLSHVGAARAAQPPRVCNVGSAAAHRDLLYKGLYSSFVVFFFFSLYLDLLYLPRT